MNAPDLRPATPADVDVVADIFTRSRAAMAFLPATHTPDAQRRFIRDHVLLAGQSVTLVQSGGAARGFLATTPGWLEHLYVRPEDTNRGLGRLLLRHAMAKQHDLRLWCFADNAGARRFYARHGFVQIGGSDGDNMERLPDVLLRWRAPA